MLFYFVRSGLNGDVSQWDRAVQMPHYSATSMPAISVYTGLHLRQASPPPSSPPCEVEPEYLLLDAPLQRHLHARISVYTGLHLRQVTSPPHPRATLLEEMPHFSATPMPAILVFTGFHLKQVAPHFPFCSTKSHLHVVLDVLGRNLLGMPHRQLPCSFERRCHSSALQQCQLF